MEITDLKNEYLTMIEPIRKTALLTHDVSLFPSVLDFLYDNLSVEKNNVEKAEYVFCVNNFFGYHMYPLKDTESIWKEHTDKIIDIVSHARIITKTCFWLDESFDDDLTDGLSSFLRTSAAHLFIGHYYKNDTDTFEYIDSLVSLHSSAVANFRCFTKFYNPEELISNEIDCLYGFHKINAQPLEEPITIVADEAKAGYVISPDFVDVYSDYIEWLEELKCDKKSQLVRDFVLSRATENLKKVKQKLNDITKAEKRRSLKLNFKAMFKKDNEVYYTEHKAIRFVLQFVLLVLYANLFVSFPPIIKDAKVVVSAIAVSLGCVCLIQFFHAISLLFVFTYDSLTVNALSLLMPIILNMGLTAVYMFVLDIIFNNRISSAGFYLFVSIGIGILMDFVNFYEKGSFTAFIKDLKNDLNQLKNY